MSKKKPGTCPNKPWARKTCWVHLQMEEKAGAVKAPKQHPHGDEPDHTVTVQPYVLCKTLAQTLEP